MRSLTREEVANLMEKVFQECQKLREAGQKEYAHDLENAFANFERLGRSLELSREKILMVYLLKHLDGIGAWVNGHRSQREDVRGRINDSIVYLILLRGMAECATDTLVEGSLVEKRTEDQVTKKDSIREALLSIAAEFGLALRCPIGGEVDPFGEIFYFVDEVKQVRSPTFSLKMVELRPEAETSRIREVLSAGPPDWLTAPIPVAQSVCGRVEEQVAEDLKPPPEVDEKFSTWFVEWLWNEKKWVTISKRQSSTYNPLGGSFKFVVRCGSDADGIGFPDKRDWVEVRDPRDPPDRPYNAVYYPRAALKQFEHEARSAYVAALKKELL